MLRTSQLFIPLPLPLRLQQIRGLFVAFAVKKRHALRRIAAERPDKALDSRRYGFSIAVAPDGIRSSSRDCDNVVVGATSSRPIIAAEFKNLSQTCGTFVQ